MASDKIVNILQAPTQSVLKIQHVSIQPHQIIAFYLCCLASSDSSSPIGIIVGVVVALIIVALIVLVLVLIFYIR